MIKVLVSSVGSANGINCIFGLRKNPEYYIIGLDMDPYAPGKNLVDKFYIMPSVHDEVGYYERLINIIQLNKVQAFIPIYSEEVRFISRMRDKIAVETDIPIMVPNLDIMNLCDDKYSFYQFLKSHGSYPVINAKLLESKCPFKLPVVVKPRRQSGSKRMVVITNISEWDAVLRMNQPYPNPDYLVQPFVQGKEYTVDFMCDWDSKFLGGVMRERTQVRDGKCIRGVTHIDNDIMECIKDFCEKLKFVGPGNVQFIEDKDGCPYFLDFNPRFAAGGLPLTIEVGFNIPDLVVKKIINPILKLEPFKEYKEGVVLSRYYTQTFFGE